MLTRVFSKCLLRVSFEARFFILQMGKRDVLPWDCYLGRCRELAAGESGCAACHCLCFLLLLLLFTGAMGSPGPEQGEGEEKEPCSWPNPGGTAPERGVRRAGFRGSGTARLVRGLRAEEKGPKNDH